MSCIFCSSIGQLQGCAELVKEYFPDKRVQFCPVCGEKFPLESYKAVLYPMEMTLQEVVELCKSYACYYCPFRKGTGGCILTQTTPASWGNVLTQRAKKGDGDGVS